MTKMRNSVEVFVPRSAAGVRTLHEGLLRELASYGPVLVGLSGYELGSSGEGAAVAAAVQAHGLRPGGRVLGLQAAALEHAQLPVCHINKRRPCGRQADGRPSPQQPTVSERCFCALLRMRGAGSGGQQAPGTAHRLPASCCAGRSHSG